MSLSKQEALFLTTFSASNRNVFTYAQAMEFFHSRVAATNTLGRLVRKGWLQRLERGSYMIIPLEAGPERQWTENAFVLSTALITPGALAYWSALRFWNMTEQIPHVQLIQTTKRKQPVFIQGTEYRFITVKENRFFGITTRSIGASQIQVTDREKTIIDIASRPELGGGITHLASILQSTYSDINWNKLTSYLLKWGGGAPAKRIGYLSETLALPIPSLSEYITTWHTLISKGINVLEPGGPDQGQVFTRWNIKVNIKI
jgi:predicted transcriptional regulator of viral defense system